MKKTFLVLALVALASLAASAKNVNVSFDGYCDAVELTVTGSPLLYVDGTHDYSACGLPNVLVGGFRHSFYKQIDPGGVSTIIDIGDPTFGYEDFEPYPLQYLLSQGGPCEWSLYVDFSGTGHVLGNAGTCTAFAAAVVSKEGREGLKPSYKGAQKQ
jgi:hypothetical protein